MALQSQPYTSKIRSNVGNDDASSSVAPQHMHNGKRIIAWPNAYVMAKVKQDSPKVGDDTTAPIRKTPKIKVTKSVKKEFVRPIITASDLSSAIVEYPVVFGANATMFLEKANVLVSDI